MPAKFADRTVDERGDKYAGLIETTDGFKYLFAFARIPCKLVGAKRKSRFGGAAEMNDLRFQLRPIKWRSDPPKLDVAVILSTYSTAKRLKELNIR